jgi:hypothetical protein
MKLTRTFLLLSILVVVAVATGCKGNTTGPQIGADPYIGGDTGVEASFEPFGVMDEKSKMFEIFEGETFPIEVKIQNKGEFAIKPGMVTVSLKGVNVMDFDNIVNNGVLTNTEDVDPVDENNKDGGEATLDFTPGAQDAKYKIPLSGTTYDVSVFAEIVYEYKTYVSVPQVCYKEDLKDDRICSPEETKTVFSSSAPLQITRAEEKLAGTGKVAMEFDVTDKDHKTDYTSVTKPGTDFDSRFDTLSYSVEPASEWDCKTNGKVNEARLDENGKATIRCVLKNPMSKGTLYTKQLDLTLHYKYRDLIKDAVRIKTQ